jgi:hypothetical protein
LYENITSGELCSVRLLCICGKPGSRDLRYGVLQVMEEISSKMSRSPKAIVLIFFLVDLYKNDRPAGYLPWGRVIQMRNPQQSYQLQRS